MSKNDISARKKNHLDICLDDKAEIESSDLYLFPQIKFIHQALPELNGDDINMKVDFHKHTIDLPLFISCMTGGSSEGFKSNKNLAQSAEISRIPVGMGSFRILLEKPELFHHFELKKYAPSVPVIGNIGMVQLRDDSQKDILKISSDLGIDLLAVHINPGQELFQQNGDRNFLNLRNVLADFIQKSPIPVIVKETGCGFTPSLVTFFKEIGALYIDVSGGGGTNWISVEGENSLEKEVAELFRQWGIPTAVSLYLSGKKAPLLASGGIKTGLDAVKSIALGAKAAGMARPFIRAVNEGGVEGAVSLINDIKKVFQTVMVLTGSKDIKELQNVPLVFDSDFISLCNQYGEKS
ncbi:MAG: type 2 isopentenyl-diphosphate Delta-isomerase [Spirochaetaceae bacterium]|jgi:isopentenyl-diphosphate delta-isomerase|nr:type 2 isopentenyl-diphosphate Delta-isomerase [Spirochaetaceae bacterium]